MNAIVCIRNNALAATAVPTVNIIVFYLRLTDRQLYLEQFM